MEVIGAQELLDDPRFTDNAGRRIHYEALAELLAPYLAARSTAAWLERLEAAGVPAGPVLSVGEMHRDPQARAREMVVSVPHSRLGPVETLGLPIKFSETPGGIRRAAPLYGEHSREVLAEFGYGTTDIEALIASGAVAAAA